MCIYYLCLSGDSIANVSRRHLNCTVGCDRGGEDNKERRGLRDCVKRRKNRWTQKSFSSTESLMLKPKSEKIKNKDLWTRRTRNRFSVSNVHVLRSGKSFSTYEI